MKKEEAKAAVDAGLDELDQLEGFFGGDDEYDDDDEDYYEGMDNKKEEQASESDIQDAMDAIDKEMADLERAGDEGFGNMFNLDLSKNCMILIVIVLILILCKEDIMKMDFFKKLFK